MRKCLEELAKKKPFLLVLDEAQNSGKGLDPHDENIMRRVLTAYSMGSLAVPSSFCVGAWAIPKKYSCA